MVRVKPETTTAVRHVAEMSVSRLNFTSILGFPTTTPEVPIPIAQPISDKYSFSSISSIKSVNSLIYASYVSSCRKDASVIWYGDDVVGSDASVELTE